MDGFDSHPGIAGYALFGARDWTFAPHELSGVGRHQRRSSTGIKASNTAKPERQRDSGGLPDEERVGSAGLIRVRLLALRHRADAHLAERRLHPHVSQRDAEEQSNNFPAHGASATPTSISYTTGAYGDGRLDTWFRSSTIRVGNRGSLTLAIDDTAQWLQSARRPTTSSGSTASPTRTNSTANTSFAIGLRQVIGDAAAAQRRRQLHRDVLERLDRLFTSASSTKRSTSAYGNPNTLDTVPQAIFKVIFYVGRAEGNVRIAQRCYARCSGRSWWP